MERAEFLKIMGTGTLLTCAGCSLLSCASDDVSPTGPAADVDFTLDLSQPPNVTLNNVGGAVSANGIVIARASATNIVAVSQACTHQGTAVVFRPSRNDFQCPNHGSVFSLSGSVTQGPATRPLRRFNTELSGNSLRVYS